jgi:putative hydrolase of the HAD superfamily
MGGASSTAPLRAVIFDWGGTLTPWHDVDLPQQWRVFAREVHGLPVEDPAMSPDDLADRRFWEPHTHTDPQVRPLWEGLHDRGLKVGVLSNTIWSRDYHREVFQRDGVLDLVDGDVYSSEIHVVKPHREAFLAACAAVGVEPTEAVYVGDRLYEDVHGPQQVGMRAIWVPHSDLPASQVVQVDVTPDAQAHELLDILGIVDGWLGR